MKFRKNILEHCVNDSITHSTLNGVLPQFDDLSNFHNLKKFEINDDFDSRVNRFLSNNSDDPFKTFEDVIPTLESLILSEKIAYRDELTDIYS